jgi:hypothetical protein
MEQSSASLTAQGQAMSVMKVRYEKLGGHYHCAFFTARAPNMTYAKNGDLVFDEREFADVQVIMSGAYFEEIKREQP